MTDKTIPQLPEKIFVQEGDLIIVEDFASSETMKMQAIDLIRGGSLTILN